MVTIPSMQGMMALCWMAEGFSNLYIENGARSIIITRQKGNLTRRHISHARDLLSGSYRQTFQPLCPSSSKIKNFDKSIFVARKSINSCTKRTSMSPTGGVGPWESKPSRISLSVLHERGAYAYTHRHTLYVYTCRSLAAPDTPTVMHRTVRLPVEAPSLPSALTPLYRPITHPLPYDSTSAILNNVSKTCTHHMDCATSTHAHETLLNM